MTNLVTKHAAHPLKMKNWDSTQANTAIARTKFCRNNEKPQTNASRVSHTARMHVGDRERAPSVPTSNLVDLGHGARDVHNIRTINRWVYDSDREHMW